MGSREVDPPISHHLSVRGNFVPESLGGHSGELPTSQLSTPSLPDSTGVTSTSGQIDKCERGTVVEQALATVPVREAPLTLEVALTTPGIRLAHRDPADRFLVATAVVFDLTLVTADRRLLEQSQAPVLANR